MTATPGPRNSGDVPALWGWQTYASMALAVFESAGTGTVGATKGGRPLRETTTWSSRR